MNVHETERLATASAEPARIDVPAGPICTTVVDELLEAQLDRGQVCTTVVDDLLDAQLAAGQA